MEAFSPALMNSNDAFTIVQGMNKEMQQVQGKGKDQKKTTTTDVYLRVEKKGTEEAPKASIQKKGVVTRVLVWFHSTFVDRKKLASQKEYDIGSNVDVIKQICKIAGQKTTHTQKEKTELESEIKTLKENMNSLLDAVAVRKFEKETGVKIKGSLDQPTFFQSKIFGGEENIQNQELGNLQGRLQKLKKDFEKFKFDIIEPTTIGKSTERRPITQTEAKAPLKEISDTDKSLKKFSEAKDQFEEALHGDVNESKKFNESLNSLLEAHSAALLKPDMTKEDKDTIQVEFLITILKEKLAEKNDPSEKYALLLKFKNHSSRSQNLLFKEAIGSLPSIPKPVLKPEKKESPPSNPKSVHRLESVEYTKSIEMSVKNLTNSIRNMSKDDIHSNLKNVLEAYELWWTPKDDTKGFERHIATQIFDSLAKLPQDEQDRFMLNFKSISDKAPGYPDTLMNVYKIVMKNVLEKKYPQSETPTQFPNLKKLLEGK